MSEQNIFFHVGLSKTGSTFLQQNVFPKLKGIYYLPTVKYRHSESLIPKIKSNKILVSREFDQQFEKEIKRFSKLYPNAVPIIVFREPSSWIFSNYKRFVKNGHPFSFKDFFDIENDKGHFKKQDIDYIRYLNLLDKHFSSKPLILFYEDLKSNPHDFVQKILNLTEAQLDFNKVNWQPRHVSYSTNSVKLIKKVNYKINIIKKLNSHGKPFVKFQNIYKSLIRYTILYGSKLLPNSLFPKEDLVSKEELNEVKNVYSAMWENVKDKAT